MVLELTGPGDRRTGEPISPAADEAGRLKAGLSEDHEDPGWAEQALAAGGQRMCDSYQMEEP